MARDQPDPFADHPWPKKGDHLFPESSVSTPSRDPDDEHAIGSADYWLREGYYRAAEMLATQLVEKEREVWSGIVFPMLYCYRHFLELSLKAIIPDLARLAEHEVEVNLTKIHDLDLLWAEFRKHSRNAFSPHEDNEPTDDIVERCINEMNQVDKSSQAFRYATDKKGKLTTDDLPLVELKQLKKTMANLRQYFEGTDIYAGEELELQRDIDSMAGE